LICRDRHRSSDAPGLPRKRRCTVTAGKSTMRLGGRGSGDAPGRPRRA
jgi:hypothetical protein